MICLASFDAQGQIVPVEDETVNVDSLKRAFADTHYYFGLYRDNYFIFGPPIGRKPTAANTNIKFQISIAQKLSLSLLHPEGVLERVAELHADDRPEF